MNTPIWQVSYLERGSSKVKTTSYCGKITRNEVVKFFGLDQPEVVWYEITLKDII